MADIREFSSSMSTPQSGSANLDITVNGTTTNYNPFGPDRNVEVEGGNAKLDITVNGTATNYKPGGPNKTLDITIPTDAVRYDTAQTLTDAQKTRAKSNIGIEPHTTYVSGMVVDTVSWTDKAQGDQWKPIRNPGTQQSLYVYEGKPTLVRIQFKGWAFGGFTTLINNNVTVQVRLTNGTDIFDSAYIEIPVYQSAVPGMQVPYNIIFMNASPKVGSYWVEASCFQNLTSTEYVYLAGTGTGNVKSMSCL